MEASSLIHEPLLPFDEGRVLHQLKHFLPAQAPLKDFVHHNLLHFYQDLVFHEALFYASKIFGYKTYCTLEEYRQLYYDKKIDKDVLLHVITEHKGKGQTDYWLDALLNKNYEIYFKGRIGSVIHLWKDFFKVNISKYVQPNLFRVVSLYLDQGISIIEFPVSSEGFLDSVRQIELRSHVSYFFNRGGRARQWLLKYESLKLGDLLTVLVGNEEWYEDYLFDVCFEHPGWSGMVSVLEENPELLLKKRKISLREFILFELLLQIDYLDHKLKKWSPLCSRARFPKQHLFEPPKYSEEFEVLKLWQESFEWTYFYQVLNAIKESSKSVTTLASSRPGMQSIHCIDDREESFRRYIEYLDPGAETFGTAGFFNFDFYYRPKFSNYVMKLAPAPAHPRHIISEEASGSRMNIDHHLNPVSHAVLRGWLFTQTIGFWAAVKLVGHLFHPHDNPVAISSEKHMDFNSNLNYERTDENETNDGLYPGYTQQEAAERISELLKSIGLTDNFAPIVYIIGHGAGSTNNPYYAAYDCGACSGKPGSVNARVACHFLNDKGVREHLKQKGIALPDDTVFIAGLHGTTSDKIYFYDVDLLNEEQKQMHLRNVQTFEKALAWNAKERARRFVTMNIKKSPEKVHEAVVLRRYSLFEPRPEYNHATNAVCIIGRRQISKHLFLDRRSFLNSYDYAKDKEGKYLANILKAVTPVCGGINLEYYFSRVDNQKLGAGSKLSHNVWLISVANGVEGDLRYGLPKQMVEIHDPLRLLVIIEQFPDIVKMVLENNENLKNWYFNEWIHMVVLHPEDRMVYRYKQGKFHSIEVKKQTLNKKTLTELEDLFETTSENILPVSLI